MDLIFASHNENKVKEIRDILPSSIHLFSLNDIGFHNEIDETGSTLEENAKIKAETIFKLTGKNVFSDDSGLFVEALNGAPGVISSRYAGTGNSEDNIEKLLRELEGIENRKAFFRTVICLVVEGDFYFLDGEIHGEILEKRRGKGGFGYDPVFVPNGETQSFAELGVAEKNQMSHRYKAVQNLLNFVGNL